MKMNNNADAIDRKLPRVAMYIWRFPPFIGGAEQQSKRLSEELIRKGIDVFIVTERVGNTKKFEFINNIPVYRVPGLSWLRRLPDYARRFFYLIIKKQNYYPHLENNKNRFKALNSITKVFTHKIPNYCFFIFSLWLLFRKRDDFDIVHVHEAHWIASFGVRIARLLKKKVIVKEALSGDLMTFNEQSVGSRKMAMQADLFIAISDGIFKDLASLGIDRKRIIKIANGIRLDSDKWQPDDGERKAICVTKINQLPNKGIDVLLEAWKILTQKYNKRVKLKILGEGDPRLFSRIVSDLNIENYVDFAGFRENIRDFLLSSYVFILPSRVEGLSNSLLEAMSLGIPCVATDISGNRDVIQNGTNGMLVPSENSEALAEAVLFMLENPDKARYMGSNARRTIEEGYTISLVADRYKELYGRLMGNRGEKGKCAA